MQKEIENDDDFHFDTGTGRFREDRSNIMQRVVDAWRDMRSSTGRLIAERPSEARLLFFVLMSDLMFFLSWTIKTVVSPTSVAESVLPEDTALLLIGALMMRTAAVYVFALVLGAGMRILGGKGSYHDTRAGIFWGSFVAAPFGLLSAMITVALVKLETISPVFGSDAISLAPLWIGLLPFVWFVSAGAAEAHGFKKVFPLFAFLSLLCVVGLIWAMYLRANGVI
ncbi:MAG TPA: Yip1 family protein [Paracoccaceae bacterium]|nr:Yip1 family protein [Paracoccaceae bacterium]